MIDPERFGPLAEAMCESRDPDVLEALARSPVIPDPDLAERAALLRLEEAYGLALRATTIARFDGIDRARAERVLDGVSAEYVTEPDAEAMERAVERRFARMAASGAVRAAFPTWSGAAPGAGVTGRIEGAVANGLPEPVAYGEGVEAALSALDPYTRAVWPSERAGWEEHHGGAYVGVGVELLDADDGGVVVGLPVVGGPAWKAGIHAGDRVVSVGGEPVPSGAAAVSVGLRGAAGSTVAIGVDARRRGARLRGPAGGDPRGDRPRLEPHRRRLGPVDRPGGRVRADRRVPSPHRRRARRADPGVGRAGDPGPAGQHRRRRDVRGERRGLVRRRRRARVPRRPDHRAPDRRSERRAAVERRDPRAPFEGLPVVVLVDRETASAAELVAGALRERAGAVLVGERTYGKGLSQALRVDEALGVGWQVTNGTWRLPSGQALQEPDGRRTGLAPDVPVGLSPAERLQVETMQRRRELPARHPDGTPVPDLGVVSRAELPALSADPQLAMALTVAGQR